MIVCLPLSLFVCAGGLGLRDCPLQPLSLEGTCLTYSLMVRRWCAFEGVPAEPLCLQVVWV